MGQAIDKEPEGRDADGVNYTTTKHGFVQGGDGLLDAGGRSCRVLCFCEIPSPDEPRHWSGERVLASSWSGTPSVLHAGLEAVMVHITEEYVLMHYRCQLQRVR